MSFDVFLRINDEAQITAIFDKYFTIFNER